MPKLLITGKSIIYSAIWVYVLLLWIPDMLGFCPDLSSPGHVAAILRSGPLHALGLVLFLGGALLATACVLVFRYRGNGTPAPFDPPKKLMFRGPYKIVRNPMYLGCFAMLFGAWFSTGVANLWAPVYTCAFIAMCACLVVFSEEPKLRAKFGVDYDHYCQTTGRWLPKIGISHPPGVVSTSAR